MSGKAGWTADEEREFSKALKSQMLITTPLTVILETLFSRIQSQATLFNEVQKRVERMEARDIDGSEILKRVKTCEEQLQEISVSKLSPFKQEEIMTRLDILEQTAGMGMGTAEESALDAENANSEALGTVVGQYSSAEVESPYAGDAPTPDAAPSPSPLAPPAPTPAVRPPSVPISVGVGSAGGAAERIALQNALARESKLEARIAELETRLSGIYNIGGKLMAVEDMAEELGVDIADMDYNPGGAGEGVERVKKEKTIKPKKEKSGGPLAIIGSKKMVAEKSVSSPREQQVGTEPSQGAAVDLDPSRANLKSAGGNRLAELTNKVASVAEDNEDLRSEIATLKDQVTALKEEIDGNQTSVWSRIDSLDSSVEGVKGNLEKEIGSVRQVLKRGAEVSYADFSALKDKVEGVMTDVHATVASVAELKEVEINNLMEDLSDLRKDVKKSGEPREMDTLFHSRVSMLESKLSDIKNEVHAAVADILDDVAKIQDLQEIEEELEMKASTLDVKQLAQQQQQLAQSVGSMAEWLAVRPEASDGAKGTGSSLTRFKCLTCDREIKTQGAGNGGPQMRGSFLPKLENYPGASHAVPGGPGLNAAEARRVIEDRLGKSRTGSPGRQGDAPTASELDEWGTGTDIRSSRSKSGTSRVPLSMPNNGMKASAPAKTPVFI